MSISELPVEPKRGFSLELPDGTLLDFSPYASVLGGDFLSFACKAVRDQDDRKFRTSRTWKDAYALPYRYLITQLATYVEESDVPSFTRGWDETEWRDFAKSLTQKIHAQWPLGSQPKKIGEINHLFTLIRQSGAITARVELDANRERKRGRCVFR